VFPKTDEDYHIIQNSCVKAKEGKLFSSLSFLSAAMSHHLSAFFLFFFPVFPPPSLFLLSDEENLSGFLLLPKFAKLRNGGV